jgi:hypothetical protein
MGVQLATVDLLEATIEALRPELERSRPIKERLHAFWAMACVAGNFGAGDVVRGEFMGLARETGLIADLRHYGEEDAAHVLSWAIRGLNPFEIGPLQ